MNIPDESNFNSPFGDKGYKYVFIDLDDTLWDFHTNAKSTMHEIFETKKLGRYFDSFEQYYGLYAKRNLELWEEYGKGTISKDELTLERFRHPFIHVGVENSALAEQIGIEYLELLPTRTALLPYAKELLDYLYPKYPLTIISNGFNEVQYKKLRSCNIEHYFTHIVLSEAAKALKPDKRIFEYALQLNKTKAREAIMIGDSYEADICGARNAGIDQVYLSQHNDLSEKKATYWVKQLKDILEII